MEISNAVTPIQLTLICILSSFLLVWMVTSLWLALRPGVQQQVQHEEIRVPLLSSQILPTQQRMAHAQLRVSDAGREMALEHSQ
jgi:hypothetical protein